MNAKKLRFAFALAITCVLSVAVWAQHSDSAAVSADVSCPAGAEISVASDGGGGSSGGDFDVQWESMIPGVFK